MRTVLFLTQVYPPDPASVGQHVADAAEEMARRGWRAVVFTADSGYDDPTVKFPRRESVNGVQVQRFRWSSGGKKSLAVRLLGQMTFVVQCVLFSLLQNKFDAVVLTTIPQIGGLAGVPVSWWHRARLLYWVMDLNPDQAVALGHFKANSWPVKMFDWLNRIVLRRARAVVALDRFMAERLLQKQANRSKLLVLPPWPHEDDLVPVAKEENPFVHRHNLLGRLVFMYSGNHSLAHPLDTFLKAMARLDEDGRFAFLFVGGGLRKSEVEAAIKEHGLKNVRSLPYQPFNEIRFSLSAADVHLVSMGSEMIGRVHPCKIYGAMALGKPILYLGPKESHIGEMIAKYDIGWVVDHGKTELMIEAFKEIAGLSREQLLEMGARARQLVDEGLTKELLCGKFCDYVENTPTVRGERHRVDACGPVN